MSLSLVPSQSHGLDWRALGNARAASVGAQSPARTRQWWIAFSIVALLLSLAAAWTAGHFAWVGAVTALRHETSYSAALHSAVLNSELEKLRSLPFVLAEDPDVRALLETHGGARAARLNRKLDGLSVRTRASAIYVMDAKGLTLAASNWQLPTTFVGSNYSFRPYFSQALRSGSAEYFALGTVSRRPGLFLARRVEGARGPVGVVAVKVEFDRLEAEWKVPGVSTLVSDGHGVVLLTSNPEWRFRTVRQLAPAERQRIREGQQFGGAPLTPLPLRPLGRDGLVTQISFGDERTPTFMQVSAPASTPGWNLHLLKQADDQLRAAVLPAQFIGFVLAACCAAAVAALVRWRERQVTEAVRQERARSELEARVEQRTAELRKARERLLVEIDERRRAEAVQQALQNDLVQASKLAVLGQIAAGVAHEINQPVAAIRAFADNAAVFVDRAQSQQAKKNLTMIASLTDRIGGITGELRAFSRKTTRDKFPVSLDQAIAGALLLMGPRLNTQRVRLVRDAVSPDVRVEAEPTRLEQVLVNLLQNALEALDGRPHPAIHLQIELRAATVTVAICDNGPGLESQTAAELFTPFVTTKANGLGLGLVISRDIMTDFGGDLRVTESQLGGAAFVLTLRRAR